MRGAGRAASVTFANLTDIGRVRARNEDSLGAFEPDDPARLPSHGRLFVVADGMGGLARGDVASRLAFETLRSAYYAADRLEPLPDRRGVPGHFEHDVGAPALRDLACSLGDVLLRRVDHDVGADVAGEIEAVGIHV